LNRISDKPQIFSIGHSNRELGDFISILKNYGIEVLADIRSYPRSKRNPHFDMEHLERELQAEGIEYIWLRGLGGMRESAYEEYTKTAEFEEGMHTLISIAGKKKTVLMCAELNWRSCHRSFISGALHKLRWEVIHIYDEGESETHSGLF
jgi:uncharacterized protein (DUF488 family)